MTSYWWGRGWLRQDISGVEGVGGRGGGLDKTVLTSADGGSQLFPSHPYAPWLYVAVIKRGDGGRSVVLSQPNTDRYIPQVWAGSGMCHHVSLAARYLTCRVIKDPPSPPSPPPPPVCVLCPTIAASVAPRR